MAVVYRELRKAGTDKQASTWWLVEGRLSAEVEALIVAAQDGSIRTRAYEVKYITIGDE